MSDLSNESPPLSDACRSYVKAHCSGCPGQEEGDGEEDENGELIGKGTDLRAVSVAGGDVYISGMNTIDSLNSSNGDVIGLDLIGDGILEFDDESDITVNNLRSAAEPDDVIVSVCTVRYGEDSQVIGSPAESNCIITEIDGNGPTILNNGSSEGIFVVTMTAKDLVIIGMLLINVVMMLIFCRRCCVVKQVQYQPVAVGWESETENEPNIGKKERMKRGKL